MKEKIKELVRYGFWGCISTGINLVLFYLFVWLGMQYIVANIVSYIIAVVFSYVFNDLFVFKGNTSQMLTKGISYFFMRGVSVVIDSAILMFLCEICNINIVIAKILDSILIIGATFIISKLFIFKKVE